MNFNKQMIVGNGLIATQFKNVFSKKDKILVFASGVSNSLCNNEDQFKREKKILLQEIKDNFKINSFIYFSTISVNDGSLKTTSYVKHKLEMEKIVLAHPKSKIFRLGQLASRNKENSYNLLNFLNNSIKSKKKINLWVDSFRSIIDVEDVVKIVHQIVTGPSIKEKIINISNPNFNSILEIVEVFEKVKRLKLEYVNVNKGNKFHINLDIMKKIIHDLEINFDNFYLERVIKKYYS